jgi:DNA uptake protein ComE-like DNA-binding protein
MGPFLQEIGNSASGSCECVQQTGVPKGTATRLHHAENQLVRKASWLIGFCLLISGSLAATPTLAGRERAAHTAQAAGQIDLNRASEDELMTIKGMTRIWAARIVRYRPYRGKNQLILDGIVPERIYAQIKDHVVAHRARK